MAHLICLVTRIWTSFCNKNWESELVKLYLVQVSGSHETLSPADSPWGRPEKYVGKYSGPFGKF